MSFLSSSLSYILPTLIVLTILVFIHELGHYSVARWCKVRIESFSIGFGPEIWGWTDRLGTRWKVSAIPFGGYVKMFGDADPASTPSDQLAVMTPEERAVSFHFKPLWQRAAVLLAGPSANFILAIVIFAALFMSYGRPFTPPDVGQVNPGSAAEAAGIKAGDVVLRVDGSDVSRFEDLQRAVQLNIGTPMHLVVLRDGAELALTATPKVTENIDRFGKHQSYGLLGITRAGTNKYVRLSPGEAVIAAGTETWNLSAATLTAFWQMITGARGTDELGGPLKIGKLTGEVAQGGILPVISLMALLSVNLGLINLFPIPVLDGGHLLFYAAEAVRGRPIGPRAQDIGFRLGFGLVLTMMVFATWNDLVRIGVFSLLKG